jgi:phage/plasmid-associated DNA primase
MNNKANFNSTVIGYSELVKYIKSQRPVTQKNKKLSNVFSLTKVGGATNLILNKKPENGLLGAHNDIPPLNRFLELVWICYLNGASMTWMEKQFYTVECDINVDESGLMIDFDIYQTDKDRHFAGFYGSIIERINKIIIDTFNLDSYLRETYAVIIQKPELTKADDLWKDGFHIIYPGLHMSKPMKSLVISKLADQITTMASNFDHFKKIDGIVDRASTYVPNQIYGCCRTGKVPHVLHSVYRITFDPFCKKAHKELCTDKFRYTKRSRNGRKVTESKYELNLCAEFSLIAEGELIKNYSMKVKPEYEQDLITATNVLEKRFTGTDDRNILNQVSRLISQDVNARELSKYINILSPHRAEDYQEWRKVCRLIAAIDINYIWLAYNFSMACVEQWNKKKATSGETSQQQIKKWFDERTSLNQIEGEKRKQNKRGAIAVIKSMAKQDNPHKYEEINKNTIFEKIRFHTQENFGFLSETDYADIVYCLANGQYVFCPTNVVGIRVSGFWYEYVTEDKLKDDKNELYLGKWRKRKFFPKKLDNIISKSLKSHIKNVWEWIEFSGKDAGEERQKSIQLICKNLKSSFSRLGNHTITEYIKRRCENSIFQQEGFDLKLDQDPSFMGVANGIIHITPTDCVLYGCNSSIKVSRTCKTIYKPYDPKNKYIIETMNILNSIIPNPTDLDYLLTWLSLSLTKDESLIGERFFGILASGGSSGKSVIGDLLSNALGLISTSGHDDTYGYTYFTASNMFTTTKANPNAADPQLVNYKYAGLVTVPEGSGAVLRMDSVKKLSDPISVRHMYQEVKSFKFGGIILYITNRPPRVDHVDFAAERRIWMGKAPMKFVDDEPKMKNEIKRDPTVKTKVKRPEYGTAMLSILIHKYHELHKKYNANIHNLFVKSTFYKQTKDYLISCDYVSEFIEDCVVDAPGNIISIDRMATEYVNWYTKNKDKKNKISFTEYKTDFENHDRFKENIISKKTGKFIKDFRVRVEGEEEGVQPHDEPMPEAGKKEDK